MIEKMLESFFSTSLIAMLVVLCVMFWGVVAFGIYVGVRLLTG